MAALQAGHIANAHVACRLFYRLLFCPPGRVVHHSSCFSSPGYQTTDRTGGGVSFLLQFVSAAAACGSPLPPFGPVSAGSLYLSGDASGRFSSFLFGPAAHVRCCAPVAHCHVTQPARPVTTTAVRPMLLSSFCPAIMRCPITGAASLCC